MMKKREYHRLVLSPDRQEVGACRVYGPTWGPTALGFPDQRRDRVGAEGPKACVGALADFIDGWEGSNSSP